jgi:hypothetical protein
MWGANVGAGVGVSVGAGVCTSVGAGVGDVVGLGVGLGVGVDVGAGVGASVGAGVGTRVGAGVGDAVGAGVILMKATASAVAEFCTVNSSVLSQPIHHGPQRPCAFSVKTPLYKRQDVVARHCALQLSMLTSESLKSNIR